MDSHGATAAALEPSVEAGSESLSFVDFYWRELRRVLGLAFVLNGDHWVDDDPAQDAFTAASRHWRSILAYDSPGPLVRRVPAIERGQRCGDACARQRRWCVLSAGRRPTSNWMKATKRSGKRSAVCHPRQAQAIALYYIEDYSVKGDRRGS